jgi:hypothetical protein
VSLFIENLGSQPLEFFVLACLARIAASSEHRSSLACATTELDRSRFEGRRIAAFGQRRSTSGNTRRGSAECDLFVKE